MTASKTATVETLTAEVRILMVGLRQVTLSVARQLDEVDPCEIEPFGRIRAGSRNGFAAIDQVEVIGSAGGQLARSIVVATRYWCGSGHIPFGGRTHHDGLEVICWPCGEEFHGTDGHKEVWVDFSHGEKLYREWQDLPLIVLAGLR